MEGLKMCNCQKGDRVKFSMHGIWYEGIILEVKPDQTHVVWTGNNWYYIPPKTDHSNIKAVKEKGAGAWV